MWRMCGFSSLGFGRVHSPGGYILIFMSSIPKACGKTSFWSPEADSRDHIPLNTFDIFICFFPFLSIPPLIEVPPQKYRCWWKEADLFSCNPHNWISLAVIHHFYLLKRLWERLLLPVPNNLNHYSVDVGNTGNSAEFLTLLGVWIHFCPSLRACQNLSSGRMSLYKFSFTRVCPLRFVLSRFFSSALSK